MPRISQETVNVAQPGTGENPFGTDPAVRIAQIEEQFRFDLGAGNVLLPAASTCHRRHRNKQAAWTFPRYLLPEPASYLHYFSRQKN